jgi:hypothetical protein
VSSVLIYSVKNGPPGCRDTLCDSVTQGVASLGLRYSARRVVGLFPGLISELTRTGTADNSRDQAGKETNYSTHAVQVINSARLVPAGTATIVIRADHFVIEYIHRYASITAVDTNTVRT